MTEVFFMERKRRKSIAAVGGGRAAEVVRTVRAVRAVGGARAAAAAVVLAVVAVMVVAAMAGTQMNQSGNAAPAAKRAAAGETAAKRAAVRGTENPGTADAGNAGPSAKGTDTPGIGTAARTGAENRQIVLSMGETPETMYISWKGNEGQTGHIRVSSDIRTLSRASEIEAVSEKTLGGKYSRCSVRLDGLEPGSRYYYLIDGGTDGVSPDKASNGAAGGASDKASPGKASNGAAAGGASDGTVTGSFRVPDDGNAAQFLYLGDVQPDFSIEDYVRWEAMTERIYAAQPQLGWAVIGGDIVNVSRDEEQWNGFFESCALFTRIPLMTVSGNHEGVSSNETYKKLFANPDNGPDADELKEGFYYFDCGSCRMIMTDSSFLTDERREKLGQKRWELCESAVEVWLEEVLAGSDRRWNIVVTHHPPYGMHDRDTVSPQLRQLWVPVMEENGADLVLCGHQHMYMRTEKINGITYIMGNSGLRESEFYNGANLPDYCAAAYADGPNYQIVEAGRWKLKITSYNEKGLIIDEAVIVKELWPDIFKFLGGDKIIVQSAKMNIVI